MQLHQPPTSLISFGLIFVSIHYVFSQTIVNCSDNQTCSYDCNNSTCQDYIIHAETASSLTILNCGLTSNGCNGLTVYCPHYNGLTDTCIIQGTGANNINNLNIYAQNAWHDVFINESLLLNTTGANTMHCGTTYNSNCTFGGSAPNQCTSNATDTTCDTYSVTLSPTIEPTLQPTTIPTTPTLEPTIEPTNQPTISTQTPTTTPTLDPSLNPSNSPTKFPTIMPTIMPTIIPTIIPTNEPTTNPTYIPSIIPTTNPTNIPSNIPTSQPSIEPTINPTYQPTHIPT
eukprot:410223_1